MPLDDLPPELVLGICSHLSYASRLALKLTNRKLHGRVEIPTSSGQGSDAVQKPYTMTDLLEIEQWPAYDTTALLPPESQQPWAGDDFFACHKCLRIRDAFHFTNKQMKGVKGKRTISKNDSRKTRTCIDCCVDLHYFTQTRALIQYGGSPDSLGGQLGCGFAIICSWCLRFVRLSSTELPWQTRCKDCQPIESCRLNEAELARRCLRMSCLNLTTKKLRERPSPARPSILMLLLVIFYQRFWLMFCFTCNRKIGFNLLEPRSFSRTLAAKIYNGNGEAQAIDG